MRRTEHGGLAPIQEALDSYLKAAGITRGKSLVTKVFEAWELALGPDLARRARPVRFRTGELCLEVDSSAVLHELASFTGEQYRRRTNAILGRELVQRTVFKQRG